MEPSAPTLPAETVEAIAGGYHGDPFSVLGPHAFDGNIVIRAFLPQADSVDLVISGEESQVAMIRTHKDGFFESVLEGRTLPVDYSFLISLRNGSLLLYEDPYAYSESFTDFDEYLLAEGTHIRMYEKLGAHLEVSQGRPGVRFAVWAPNALRVSVIGDFNSWDGRRHPMRFHSNSGIWDIFMPDLSEGAIYKYEIKTRYLNYTVNKTDPVGFFSEMRPKTASIVWDLDKYEWQDSEWLERRREVSSLNRPINAYEVHLGSWRRKSDNQWLTYLDLIDELIPYVLDMGYTHVELLPIAEHPFDGSWGYQVTGYFAATSRFGTPNEFMAFVDACHQAGIGVILDWVPAHFPRDQHGLAFFDGTSLYEHDDPRQGTHPDWGTLVFNFGRNEVRQFLISNAIFWLAKYHIDGLRVDAVASMLYLDFSREAGEWVPNRYGGRENLEAIDFIREFNARVHDNYPDVLTIAEESTSWSGVSRSVEYDGLGFDLKWNMGWMHDSLQYFSNDPIYRSFHHGTLTFSLLYAFSEHFLLPFSHDEVVHLKRSMLDKMPGDVWQKFANLRALYAYQAAHPGKKMLFMGGEFGQWREWTEEQSLDWHLLDLSGMHHQLQSFVRDLNRFYTSEPAFYSDDHSWAGFTWIDLHDNQRSVLAFSRNVPDSREQIFIVCNFTPTVRYDYRLGVPYEGQYTEVLNSDDFIYGGSGVTNPQTLDSTPTPWHDRPFSITFTLPPLGVVFIKVTASE
ncbi:MAG: 1,4-alpha-glucan branching protein GlgB [Candidatus Promineifilaceae bacterium]